MEKNKLLSKDALHTAAAIIIGILIKMLLPASDGLTELGVRALSVLVPTIYVWLTVSTGWTTIVAMCGLIMTGVLTYSATWQGVLAASACMIIITCIPLNVALQETGVIKAIVSWFISRKFVEGKPFAFMAMFLGSATIIGFFFQSVTLAIIFCTLGQQVCSDLGYKKGDAFYNVLILGVLWVSVITNGATPIAHAVPVILMTLLETNTQIVLTYGQYMSVGIPAAFVLLGVYLACAKYLWKVDTSLYKNYDAKKMANTEPLGKAGKFTFILFILVVVTWLFPDVFAGILPEAAAYVKGIGIATPAVFAIALLCLVQFDGKPAGNFNKLFSTIPLPTVIFTGFVTLFGSVVGMESTGIQVWLQTIFSPVTAGLSPLVMVIICIAGVYIVTSFISNTVAIIVFYSISVAIMLGMGMNVIPYVVLLGITGNLGALTPSASPNAGYFYGNFFEIKDVAKYNLSYIAISCIVLLAVVYPYANIIL